MTSPSSFRRSHSPTNHARGAPLLTLSSSDSRCDEIKPECGNCLRFGVCCDFSPIPSHILRPTPATSSGPGRRGRPRSDWASWTEQIRLSSNASIPGGLQGAHGCLNVTDLELFHNYMTTTANTLHEGNHRERGLWCEGVPQLGFQHPCVLAFLLSLSSYHMARLKPPEARKYLDLAEQHLGMALQTATILLGHVNHENGPAAYIISILICFIGFAKGPSPGNLLLISEDQQVPYLNLLRGVRLVISSVGWNSIFSGVLAEYYPKPSVEREAFPLDPTLLEPGVEDWRASLNDVLDLITVFTGDGIAEAYRHEVKVLTGCCEKTFGKGQNASLGVVGKLEVVMVWIYQVGDVYVEGLTRKDPIAMLILGHFCVLLRTVERYWFTQGWASHIMNEVLAISERSRKWLTWPLAYLSGQSTLLNMSEI
ncbi:Zn(2)-C6 fungal-type domain-containing protein [Fusarium falciforme]|uniref:Zn(2)-C6 fungal-type domain-containing protein n=1 Tax=Fusarium falciforme TaxID=195108 RepID=UPI0022FFD12C|nr:Zn(2)-C6 fungal-type domain-containing protein [Fusarium falciforme]WAO92660.1 Zn(2)-C6 fungal-type domain-containing protein [Fusarium falciforme]